MRITHAAPKPLIPCSKKTPENHTSSINWNNAQVKQDTNSRTFIVELAKQAKTDIDMQEILNSAIKFATKTMEEILCIFQEKDLIRCDLTEGKISDLVITMKEEEIDWDAPANNKALLFIAGRQKLAEKARSKNDAQKILIAAIKSIIEPQAQYTPNDIITLMNSLERKGLIAYVYTIKYQKIYKYGAIQSVLIWGKHSLNDDALRSSEDILQLADAIQCPEDMQYIQNALKRFAHRAETQAKAMAIMRYKKRFIFINQGNRAAILIKKAQEISEKVSKLNAQHSKRSEEVMASQ